MAFTVDIEGEYGTDDGAIRLLDGDSEIVMWDNQEWAGDPSLMYPIVNAIKTGYERGSDAVRERLNRVDPLDDEVEFSNRGIKRFAPIEAAPGYDGSVQVYESSAASGPHVWLSVENAHFGAVHLPLAKAQQLRDQLDYLIRNHYQNEV